MTIIDKDSLNNKIKNYMKIKCHSSEFENIMCKFKNTQVLEDSLFMLNPSGDIAMMLHDFQGNSFLHKHDFFELIYVYSGKCVQIIDDKEFILNEGQLCLINTKAIHSVTTENDEDNIVFNFLFKKSFFSRHFLNLINENNVISSFLINYFFEENSKKTHLILNTYKYESLKQILFKIIIEFIDENLGFRSIIESLYVILFIEIARNNLYTANIVSDDKKRHIKINEILMYLEQNCCRTTLEKTAQHFHYHPAYLSKAIKSATNKTYSQIIKEMKLKTACFYLTKTNMSLKQILERVGYKELSHFHHIFKKEFNMTPSQYRNKFRE